jgi:hypothetical protein
MEAACHRSSNAEDAARPVLSAVVDGTLVATERARMLGCI